MRVYQLQQLHRGPAPVSGDALDGGSSSILLAKIVTWLGPDPDPRDAQIRQSGQRGR